jgi:hypothetical protein
MIQLKEVFNETFAAHVKAYPNVLPLPKDSLFREEDAHERFICIPNDGPWPGWSLWSRIPLVSL